MGSHVRHMPRGCVHRLLQGRLGVPLLGVRRPNPRDEPRGVAPRAGVGLRGLRACARGVHLQGRRSLTLRHVRR